MKYLVLPFLLFFMAFNLVAQEEEPPNEIRENVIYLEALGSVVAGVGLGYERYFPLSKSTKFSGRIGLGLVESFTQPSPSIGGSTMFGGKANFEVGFNFMVNPDIEDEVGTSGGEMDTALQFLIGFRYQDWDDGFMFRIFLVPPIGAFEPDYLYIPYGGLTFGFAF